MIGKNIHEYINEINSQKAKSLLNVKIKYGDYISGSQIPTTYPVLPDEKFDLYRITNGAHSDWFVRSCPLIPRPGILESRRCTYSELPEVVKEMQKNLLENEPEGCLIIQPYIDSTYSSVVAPNMHAIIGRGNDGITAGEGFSIPLPIGEADPGGAWLHGVNEDPNKVELEYVYSTSNHDYGRSFLTQVRAAESHKPIGPSPHRFTRSFFLFIEDCE